MTRGYNFGAGPATLPQAVLEQAQQELLDWQGEGMSVMEISHRSDAFGRLIEQAEQDLRQLMSIPDNYKVLFINGSGRQQFAMVAMNLLEPQQKGDYLVTGTWSNMAYAEATRVAKAHCVASGKDASFLAVPPQSSWQLSDDAAYFYFTPNETISGLAIEEVPQAVKVPVVADMTSCILSRQINVADYGIIFAGSQKNIGPAGLAIVIIDEQLLKDNTDDLPTLMDYRTHIKHRSMYATPATFNCYMAGLMFKWLLAQGGVAGIEKVNRRKAAKLYQYLDNSDFYHCPIEQANRSIMNAAFILADTTRDQDFLSQAKQHGLLALKGHRSVGGMRASIYNSMPEEGVDALIDFMKQFAGEA